MTILYVLVLIVTVLVATITTQFSKVLLAIDNLHIVPQGDLDYGPCLGGLNQVYMSNITIIL